jgi:hypothetical protein
MNEILVFDVDELTLTGEKPKYLEKICRLVQDSSYIDRPESCEMFLPKFFGFIVSV